MRILTAAATAALVMLVPVAADAQPGHHGPGPGPAGPDGHRGPPRPDVHRDDHHRHHHRTCRTVWHHHHRERRCY